jgi:type VI secretion system lysozyme-like protein
MDRYDEAQDTSTSVLDRLLESEPSTNGSPYPAGESVVASIVRDLHILLNTRRQEILIDPDFDYCNRSILRFGVPDLTQCGSLLQTNEQKRVCNWLEEAIRLFEPRLRKVSVRLIPAPSEKALLRFQLEATAELVSGRIAFDMALKRDTGEFSIRSGGEV